MLTSSFFNRPTPVVAQDLIGKQLICKSKAFRGIIVETEAYTQEEPACHAFNGKRTSRNTVMFDEPGTIYVYFIYGMYYCLNIVTEEKNRGCAVLIRGLKSMDETPPFSRLNGPGKLCKTLDITTALSGTHINDPASEIQILEGQNLIATIQKTARIGISKATELQWRFVAGS